MKPLTSLLLLSSLLAVPHAHAVLFGFDLTIRGGTQMVRPGVLKTDIIVEKVHDVTFNHELGLPFFLGAVPYQTTEKVGHEDACARAQSVALTRGLNACFTKYARCQVKRVSLEEGERHCAATVFTQGEGAKKTRSASREESEEPAESRDAV